MITQYIIGSRNMYSRIPCKTNETLIYPKVDFGEEANLVSLLLETTERYDVFMFGALIPEVTVNYEQKDVMDSSFVYTSEC